MFDTIKDTKDGTFPGGQTHVFGLKDDGVDWVYDDKNEALIPDEVHARVEALRAEIVSGAIVVPSE